MKACFAWSLGAKARLWEHQKGLGILAGARYLRYDNRPAEQWKNETGGYRADAYWSTHDRLDYWQVDLTVTGYWRLGAVSPFVGLGWSYSETRLSGRWAALSDPSVYVDYDSSMYDRNQFSATVGIEIEATPNLRLNLYSLLVARTVLGLGLSWVF